MKRTTIFLLAVAVAVPLALDAQSRRDRRGGDRDRPDVGTARISVTDGDVLIVRPSGDQFEARSGDALFPDDSLVTKERSRAEVQLDRGNFVRLDAHTEMRVHDLGNKFFSIEVVKGTVGFSQLRRSEADVDIDTELATVRPLKRGRYIVEHRTSGQTAVTIRNGSAEVATDRDSRTLKDGRMTVRGEADNPAVQTAKARGKSEFDDWNKRRDKLLDRGGARPWLTPTIWAGYGWGYPWGWGGYGFGRGSRVAIGVGVGRGGFGRGRGRGRIGRRW